MQTPLTYSEVIENLRAVSVGCPIRVDKKIAKSFLLENKKLNCDGRVFYLGIRKLGLGVYEVWRIELAGSRTTKMFPA